MRQHQQHLAGSGFTQHPHGLSGDAFDRVLGHYRRLAARAGFSAEHQRRGADHLLGGVNPRSDGAFVVIVTPLARGSDVALIVNNGR